MSNVKTILISQFPLPYSKIGSWTAMYNHYLSKYSGSFDFVICPEVINKAENSTYQFLRDVTVMDKVKNKLVDKQSRYKNYIDALDVIIRQDEKYVLHIVDNSGIIAPINTYLSEKNKRSNFYIQYCYHGFAPIVSRKDGNRVLNVTDEIIFLTQLAYKEFKNYYDECTFRARVAHNGVDSRIFKKVSKTEKQQLRQQLGISEANTVFMWCSQDRPKKGLNMVLEAFYDVHKKDSNTELIIVGIEREISQEGVKVIGKVPNKELPKYYQIADVYLFPSLWKEGFGIVLAEALKCGCYCIASNQGGIPEVLNNGEYGVLVENPNFVEEWITEMNKAITILKIESPYLKVLPEAIYKLENWSHTMNEYIQKAKVILDEN